MDDSFSFFSPVVLLPFSLLGAFLLVLFYGLKNHHYLGTNAET